MRVDDIKLNKIYESIIPLEAEAFVYVRARNGDEIGFSVLDRVTDNPDFSDCGVFWMTPENFVKVFKEHR